MAKIAFSKLGLTKDTSIETFDWNDQTIEVKTYLPMHDKLQLISDILNYSVDNNGYYSPAKVYVNMIIEIILTYTNITITEKQKEDREKLYDLFVSSGFSGKVIGEAMNPNEYAQIKTWTAELIHSIYEYKNSIYGILDGITEDYSNLNLDIDNLKDKLSDQNNLELLRAILAKLG